ncbi:MAG: hypothetical protein IKV16_04000 [Clostridia bacterium]|nr:hypothetical protein [Clostridia bacterium]
MTKKNKYAFTFTVDDNIRVFKEIAQSGYDSIFEHPYLAMYKRLHDDLGIKVQLNLFYRTDGFTLSEFSDRYSVEFSKNSDWLKLSFHSDHENVRPYEFSSYEEVFSDAKKVNSEILRFAGESSLAKTTTVHYCLATPDGVRAISDNGVLGLLGLYGKNQNPSISYSLSQEDADTLCTGVSITRDNITHAALDIVLNVFEKEEILRKLSVLYGRALIKIMIHEQYFYSDYTRYQKDFEEKVRKAAESLIENGYESVFFEETL